MFDECVLELWPENGHQRALNQLNKCFLHILSVAMHYPALWTEAIYDLRESRNCPRTFDTYFKYELKLLLLSNCTTTL